MMETQFQSIDRIDARLPKGMQVYEILRNDIISMRLTPGTNLQEKDICAQLGISRTPLREAFLQLAKEGLIHVVPSDGTFVSKIVPREVLTGHLIRDTTEVRLVRLAARHFRPEFEMDFELNLFRQKAAADRKQTDEFFMLDNQFHQLVCNASGFAGAWATIHAATGQLDRVRRQAFPIEEHFQTVYAEHQAIYQHLRDHDEDAAVAVFQEQLDSAFPSLRLLHATFPDLIAEEGDFDIDSIR